MIKIPPANAVNTYKMLPMLFIIGPKMLAYLFALSASLNNALLSLSNSCSTACSWQKTLTTFSPFIISSI